MAVVLRIALCLSALLVISSRVEGKPFFDNFFCDWMCDDDDILYDDTSSVSTTTSFENLFDFDCGVCPLSQPRSTTTTTTASPLQGQAFNMNFLPSPFGVNFTMLNTGTSWLMNMIPYLPGGGGTPMPPPAAAPPAAPAAPAAAAPPAAPAADNATAPAEPAA